MVWLHAQKKVLGKLFTKKFWEEVHGQTDLSEWVKHTYTEKP